MADVFLDGLHRDAPRLEDHGAVRSGVLTHRRTGLPLDAAADQDRDEPAGVQQGERLLVTGHAHRGEPACLDDAGGGVDQMPLPAQDQDVLLVAHAVTSVGWGLAAAASAGRAGFGGGTNAGAGATRVPASSSRTVRNAEE